MSVAFVKMFNDSATPQRCARRFQTDQFRTVLRCFTVGHSEKYLNRHCGQHTMIMRACTQSPAFSQIANTCRRRAELLFKHGEPVIKVLCICDRGMHGSVAVATTLQAVYQQQGCNGHVRRVHALQAEQGKGHAHIVSGKSLLLDQM